MATFPRLAAPGPVQSGDQSLVNAVPTPQAGQMGKAVGAGLMQLGEAGVKIAQEAAKANDARVLIEADGRMRKAELEFAQWKNEHPDESTWVKEAQTRLSGLESQYSKVPLTPNGRLQLQDSLNRFSTGALIRVQAQAFDQAGKRAVGTADNVALDRAHAGDLDAASTYDRLTDTSINPWDRDARKAQVTRIAAATVQEQVKNQLATFAGDGEGPGGGDVEGIELLVNDPKTQAAFKGKESELARLHQQYIGQATQVAWKRTIEADIATNPKEALAKLSVKNDKGDFVNYPEAGIAIRTDAIRLAQRSIDYNDAVDQKKLIDAYSAGVRDFKEPRWAEVYSRLSPTRQREMDALLLKAPENNPVEFQKFQTRVAAADLRDELTVVQLETEAAQKFSGPMLKGAESVISKRMEGDKTPRAEADLFQEVDADTENGLHGDFKITGDKIEVDPKTGQAFKIDAGTPFPWYLKPGAWVAGIPALGATKKPISLSEEDRAKWLKEKPEARPFTFFEDQDAKRDASTKASDLKAKLERLDGSVEDKRAEYYKQTNSPKRDAYLKILQEREAGTPLIPTEQPRTQLVPTADEISKLLKQYGK